MTNYNYGDIIEYIDNTLDKNFNDARNWAKEHGTTFDERLDLRELPKRYFQIGPEVIPPTPPIPPEPQPPTEEELKDKVRMERNYLLSETDYTQLSDAPITEEDKAKYREYRQYLRDYTEQENWWLQNPDDYETWLVAHHPVTGE